MSDKRYGKIAEQYGYHLELQVLRSNAGYYLGTIDNAGIPISRESTEYYEYETEANLALRNNLFTQVILEPINND